MSPEPLANPSFDPIAVNRLSDTTARRHSEPGKARLGTRGCAQQHESRGTHAYRAAGHALKVASVSEPIAAPEALVAARTHLLAVVTASRRRPLARRRFKTLRPACVFIRARKPCVRRRRIRLGW